MLSGTSVDQAEMAVLGFVITSGGVALDDLALTGDDFGSVLRGEIFDLVRTLWTRGTPVDRITVGDEMFRRGGSMQRDGVGALVDAIEWAQIIQGNLAFYEDMIAREALARRLEAVGLALQNLADVATTAEMSERAQRLVDEAIGTRRGKVRFVRDILPEVLEDLDQGRSFTPTPWPSLNESIGGLRPGAVYVIAARPGIGKTVIAQQLAVKLSQSGVVAFTSLEMSDRELVHRIIAERAGIHIGRIKSGELTARDKSLIAAARTQIEVGVAIDDRANVTIGDIRQFARQVSRYGSLSGIVVDYLQLMSSRGNAPRHEQVAEFSRQLKILAKTMNVPVVALSQLNRNSEQSALAAPKLSDLRESGAIEQDADVVILLSREGNGEIEGVREHLILDVAKNRHGRTGIVRLDWDGGFSRALDFTGETG